MHRYAHPVHLEIPTLTGSLAQVWPTLWDQLGLLLELSSTGPAYLDQLLPAKFPLQWPMTRPPVTIRPGDSVVRMRGTHTSRSCSNSISTRSIVTATPTHQPTRKPNAGSLITCDISTHTCKPSFPAHFHAGTTGTSSFSSVFPPRGRIQP